MASCRRLIIPLSCALLAVSLTPAAIGAGRPAPRNDAAAVAFFEKKVRPVLADNCYNCHSADTNAKGGLRVDDHNGLLQGGGRGPAIVPFHPEKSLLIRAISYADAKLKMPPKKHLSAEQIAVLTQWIKEGAAWPPVNVPVSLGKRKPFYDKLRKQHWAWQPLRRTQTPPVIAADWPRTDVDRYILALLEQKGFRPVKDADRRTLIRRVTFDLTGLPPTPEEVAAFIQDATPGAFTKLVDRLLASPAFGERWGRHWLDVARYGESTGSARNLPYPQAWRYRDYVIKAFNHDKRYDVFLHEQIAGDLLPAKSQEQRDEQLIATGFLALGVKDVNQRFKVRFVMDNIDEQIDTVTRSVLALTVSCARCHDHKFDPIPTTDYYALAGIFHSTDLCAGVRNKMGGGGLDYYDPQMLLQLGSAKRPDQVALGCRDARVVGDTAIRIRGEAEKHGPVVPRGFLSALDVPNAPKINPKQSGRLELAQWLTTPKNPLTSRVMVNRVWHHLFGQGLVPSVDNFGVTGDAPSHPELLDNLAEQFVRDGWSVKKLIRTLVLSRAYQLGLEAPAGHVALDPANRLVWRHSPRRLEAEEIRDAMLAAAGTLNRSRFVGSPAQQLKVMELGNNGPQARSLSAQALVSRHRSVYLPLLRTLVPRALEVFDFAEQGMVTGRRDTTTVATQALYLLNDPFVRRQALALAKRLHRQSDLDEADRIHLAYRLTLGRGATAKEMVRVKSYLADYQTAVRKLGESAPALRPARGAKKGKRRAGSGAGDAIWPADPQVRAWASFCQALLGSAEFRYIK
jgi:hypothetical protein